LGKIGVWQIPHSTVGAAFESAFGGWSEVMAGDCWLKPDSPL
jgi:hypothetical protein